METTKKKMTGDSVKSGSFTIQGNWEKQSKSLQEKYPKLTKEDVNFETGKEKDLFRRLESKLGKNRKEVIEILKTNQHVKAV